MTKRIIFLTGTRADFGKIKSLIRGVEENPSFEYSIFVTGMHTLSRYGYTVDEVHKAGFKNIHMFMNQVYGESMDLVLANTIQGLARYVHEYKPDMIVVHGDRIEALAGAVVGALNNILVAHIEGGEVSGTIDELIRHSISKLSHLHFVANQEAFDRLRQLGEDPKSIFIIGSPDIDVMLSANLPSLDVVKSYYEINFENYSLVLFHPVTTELEILAYQAKELVESLIMSGKKYVVIYPNNDVGSNEIFDAYKLLKGNENFRLYPSMRFEYFLTLLKHADFVIGNSSVGIREAPVYAVPTINIGTRQENRFSYSTIVNVVAEKRTILDAISSIALIKTDEYCMHFGDGNSSNHFMRILQEEKTWETSKQKLFYDMVMQHA